MLRLLCGTALLVTIADASAAATLKEAMTQAYGTSPVLTAARAKLRATDEGVPIAKADSRLQVSGTVGVSQSTNGITRLTNGGRVLTGGINLNYPLFQGGRVRNAIHAAEARDVAGRADLRTTEGDLFTDVVGAYEDVLRDAAIVDLNVKNVRVLETNLKASRDRFQVGDLTRTDVAQSEARLSIARSQLATAQGNLTGSREQYRRIVGAWPEALDQPPPLPPLPATPDEAVRVALDNSPAIAAITANAQAAGYDVRTAAAQRLPTFAAVGGSSYNNYLGTRAQASGFPRGTPGFDQVATENSVGVQLSVPLYQGGGVAARVRQARALESEALEQSIDVERQVIANARAAFAGFAAATQSIGANEQAVKANQLALEGTRAENTAGTRTVLEVLNAEQELLNAQVSLVSARRDQYVAGFALLNAMGRAEARSLNLDGGALYDPLANYNRVRNRMLDLGGGRRAAPEASRTGGATPDDPDVRPLVPDPELPPGKAMTMPAPATTGMAMPAPATAAVAAVAAPPRLGYDLAALAGTPVPLRQMLASR